MILRLTEDRQLAYFDGKTLSFKNIIKAIPGADWKKKERRWVIPIESVGDAKRIWPSLEVSPDVLEAHQALKSRYEQALAAKTINVNSLSTHIPGIKGQLYPYQAQGKAFLDSFGHCEGGILAFDMGLGKSISSLATFVDWKNKGIVDYCLVVCPSPLKYSTWEKELKKWTDLTYTVIDGDKSMYVDWDDNTVSKLDGKKLREVQYMQWQFGASVIIMNYELFLHDSDILKHLKVSDRWAVIMDECQRVKNHKSKTTKNLMKLVRPAGKKILGSGTPLENNIEELWSLADICKPGILGSYFRFQERYCETDYFGRVVAPKPELMQELKDRLAPIMFRMTKKEALPNLPELVELNYWVDMTPVQAELYKDIKEGIIANAATCDFTYIEALAQLTRFQQLLDSPRLLAEVVGHPDLPIESGKLKELENIVKDLDPTRTKFILFSQYREMTDILYSWLQDKKLLKKEQIGYIRGGMKSSEVAAIQAGFQTGSLQLVLMTTAGNYGIDLSAGSYVICYDCLFNPQKMAQIYARAHRNGVKSAVTAINLLTKGTYEEKKLNILESKKELFRAMIDSDDKAFAKLFTVQDLMSLM